MASFFAEITKDSSGGSLSGPENFSDEEDVQSSTSGLVSSQQSPITPEPHSMNGSQKAFGTREPTTEKGGRVRDHQGSADSKKQQGRKSPHRPHSGGKLPRSPAEGSVADKKHFSPASSTNSGYHELLDNNAFVPNKIRDDIPDSELIDYEDDGGESLIESVTDFDEQRVRIFIALFDYDPTIMSPNPDALDEELPFKEGQLIKVRKRLPIDIAAS